MFVARKYDIHLVSFKEPLKPVSFLWLKIKAFPEMEASRLIGIKRVMEEYEFVFAA